MLSHGVLCIFLTTPRSYAAVDFYFGRYEKPRRYGKLATSYLLHLRLAWVNGSFEALTQVQLQPSPNT
jgi:hypothetical protein